MDAETVAAGEDEIEGPKRWLVEIDYRTDSGTSTVDHHIEELLALMHLVEWGPDWNTIEQIRIGLNPDRRLYDCTVETAKQEADKFCNLKGETT
jgi:hypothetical protein